jgi:hypothetical protein
MKPAGEEEVIDEDIKDPSISNIKLRKKPVQKVAKPSGEKPKEVPIAGTESGQFPKQSPDAQNLPLKPPANQIEGEPTDVADCPMKVTPKNSEGQPTESVGSEMIGHNPNAPMPQKIAEDLIANAKWGVQIGAYTSVKEGIDRQLGRKAYAEFVDTDEKLQSVIDYLTGLTAESEPTPVA